MGNPILEALQRSGSTRLPPALQQFKQLRDMARSAGNPQAMLQNMLRQNPQYDAAMRLVQQSGGDARSAFYALAKQKGVDPDQILAALK